MQWLSMDRIMSMSPTSTTKIPSTTGPNLTIKGRENSLTKFVYMSPDIAK
jgi:hypothetical protein